MSFKYDPSYFLNANPIISDNDQLREPQIQGYYHVYDHFIVKNKSSHALVILPTGVGKTGLIGLLPYNICNGRLLIITPQIVIKDTVVDALNPELPDNFWLKRGVFSNPNELPSLVEFESNETPIEVLEAAHIVVLNAQKLQSRLESSPLNFLPDDFFDMIIIDEAHHSTARTWVETTQYFSKAKVVKVTGTPFRSDGVDIAGELVYKYKLSQAMANDYVKSLENIVYVPDTLFLTIDGDKRKTYTVEQIYESGIKDEDWIRRSVAYSPECTEIIVDKSIQLLKKKLEGNNKVPHKIIAVACSITHAEEIKLAYERKEYDTAIIHSDMSESDKDKAKNDIKNHRVKVVVHVSMLGEGYDHPYLSVAAIFRPFKSALPYAQFIGRILRTIPKEEIQHIDDNIGQIVSHEHLGLRDLWEYYKVEIQESEIIKHLRDIDIMEDGDGPADGGDRTGTRDNDIGIAKESGTGKLISDVYLDTELIKRKHQEDKEREKKIIEIQNILKVNREDATKIIDQAQGSQSDIKRPDKYFASKRKDIDVTIKEKIVPELIGKYNIEQNSNTLKECVLFRGRYSWLKKINNNGGMLAAYFINYLNYEIGYTKKLWTIDDYDIAFGKLTVCVEYVEKILSDFCN